MNLITLTDRVEPFDKLFINKIFKLLNFIFVKVPENSSDYDLGLPYSNYLWYNTGNFLSKEERMKQLYNHNWLNKYDVNYFKGKGIYATFKERKAISVKYIKPNTGIKYKIKGKLFNYVIIKIK